MAEELIEFGALQAPPQEQIYERNGVRVTCHLNFYVITADFLAGLAAVADESRAQRTNASLAAAVATSNRRTRRAAKRLDVPPPASAGQAALAAREREMDFLARTCDQVVASWNLAVKGKAVAPTHAFFRTWDYDLLSDFFEWAVFRAGAPKKNSAPPSDDSSSTATA